MRQLCKKCEISPCSLVLIHIGNESLDNRIRKRNQKCWLCRIKFVHSIFLVGIFRHKSFQKTFHQTRMEKVFSTFSGVHVKHELLIRSMFMNRNETGRCSWKKNGGARCSWQSGLMFIKDLKCVCEIAEKW